MLEAAWFNVDSTSKCLNGRFQLIWLPWLLHEWWHSWRASLLLHFSTVQTCLSKDSANPQHSISARWLKNFSKSKNPTPEKAKKIWFPILIVIRIHGRRNELLSVLTGFFYCCSPFTDIFIDLRFSDFDKIGNIWKNSLTMEKISNKISSNFGVSPPHFSPVPLAAMVFESLMGSAWAVIWLGRGKWAKRPTQLGGGFKHFFTFTMFHPDPWGDEWSHLTSIVHMGGSTAT